MWKDHKSWMESRIAYHEYHFSLLLTCTAADDVRVDELVKVVVADGDNAAAGGQQLRPLLLLQQQFAAGVYHSCCCYGHH
jgi:hypothetical protein